MQLFFSFISLIASKIIKFSIEREMKHFKFGENWKNFSNLIDDNRLKEHLLLPLKKLTNKKSLNNLSFLDIGCGSGLSSLAIQLNVKKSMQLIQDEQSIKTQQKSFTKIKFKKV